jgi:hypothetical protein
VTHTKGEIDFVVRDGAEVHAVECTIRPDRFDGRSLAVFRASYPRGRNVVVSPGVAGSLVVRVMDCRHLAAELSATDALAHVQTTSARRERGKSS